MDDGSGRGTERRKPIDDPFQVVDVGDDDLHDVAVLPGNAVAFNYLRGALRRRLDRLQLTHDRADPQNRGNRVARSLCIDGCVITLNNPRFLEAPEPIPGGGG